MHIVLVSDGKYGDRAFETIMKKFDDVEMVLAEARDMNETVDDYQFTSVARYALDRADLIISYIRHPDINLELAKFGKPLVIAIDHGPGYLKQVLAENSQVAMPSSMCGLEPVTGIEAIDTFARAFGLPRYEIELDESGSRILTARSVIESPCGATERSLSFLTGAPVTPVVLNAFAINIAQECRESVAYMMAKSDSADRATSNHVLPLLAELERQNPGFFANGGILEGYAKNLREKGRKRA